MQWVNRQKGFTIVELLIVVVVIAILAAITIVSYNGIQNRAKQASVKTDIEQAIKTLEIAKVTSTNGLYPSNQVNANLKASSGNTVTYVYYSTDNTYCVQSVNGSIQYFATSTVTTIGEGSCETNGLVGWWRLNGNGDDSSIGASAPVTLTGTPTMGQNGQANSAYAFTGTQTGIVSGSQSIIPSTMSFSFWVRPISWGSTATAFIGKRSTSNSDGVFIMYLASSASLAIDCGGTTNRWSTGYVPQLNQWTHIVVSCTPSTITAYANGALIDSSTKSNTSLSNGTDLGFGHDRGAYYLNGSMDDIRLYNRALSLTEAQQLYTNGAQ